MTCHKKLWPMVRYTSVHTMYLCNIVTNIVKNKIQTIPFTLFLIIYVVCIRLQMFKKNSQCVVGRHVNQSRKLQFTNYSKK